MVEALNDCMCDCGGKISHLPALFPVSGLLGFIRFDATDVVWSTFHQCAHQIIGLSLKSVIRARKGKTIVMRLMMITMSKS